MGVKDVRKYQRGYYQKKKSMELYFVWTEIYHTYQYRMTLSAFC